MSNTNGANLFNDGKKIAEETKDLTPEEKEKLLGVIIGMKLAKSTSNKKTDESA